MFLGKYVLGHYLVGEFTLFRYMASFRWNLVLSDQKSLSHVIGSPLCGLKGKKIITEFPVHKYSTNLFKKSRGIMDFCKPDWNINTFIYS